MSANGEWELRHVFYSRYVPRATRIIVPNAAGREQLMRHFHVGPERVLVAAASRRPSSRSAAASAGPAREPEPGIEPPYLLYPAQFWSAQEPRDAARARSRSCPSYTLGLRGLGQGLARARRGGSRASSACCDRVRFLGFVDTDELVALYRGAHALVYLSFFGPENLPPLEAFALGCPVVQADVPGAREQLGDAALLVPPTDAGGRRRRRPALRGSGACASA